MRGGPPSVVSVVGVGHGGEDVSEAPMPRRSRTSSVEEVALVHLASLER